MNEPNPIDLLPRDAKGFVSADPRDYTFIYDRLVEAFPHLRVAQRETAVRLLGRGQGVCDLLADALIVSGVKGLRAVLDALQAVAAAPEYFRPMREEGELG